jgi:hypothetical protein
MEHAMDQARAQLQSALAGLQVARSNLGPPSNLLNQR